MKNILVIDDDLIIGRLIEKLAQRIGAVTTIVKNGEDARSALQSKTRFNIIFLDLIMPTISGWDILTIIKNDPATVNVPVVILTGALLSEEETARLQSRVLSIINKRTFDNEQIEDILKGI